MTKEQTATLERKHTQSDQGLTLAEFMASAEPTFGAEGAIAVPWCGMWLCVETDGYCHT